MDIFFSSIDVNIFIRNIFERVNFIILFFKMILSYRYMVMLTSCITNELTSINVFHIELLTRFALTNSYKEFEVRIYCVLIKKKNGESMVCKH